MESPIINWKELIGIQSSHVFHKELVERTVGREEIIKEIRIFFNVKKMNLKIEMIHILKNFLSNLKILIIVFTPNYNIKICLML